MSQLIMKFGSKLLDMMYEKPFVADAFRQGHIYGVSTRRIYQAANAAMKSNATLLALRVARPRARSQEVGLNECTS